MTDYCLLVVAAEAGKKNQNPDQRTAAVVAIEQTQTVAASASFVVVVTAAGEKDQNPDQGAAAAAEKTVVRSIIVVTSTMGCC
jgi:hypothetical protein